MVRALPVVQQGATAPLAPSFPNDRFEVGLYTAKAALWPCHGGGEAGASGVLWALQQSGLPARGDRHCGNRGSRYP